MNQAFPQVTMALGKDTEPRYLPIGQYGVVGDCRTAALIAPNGSIDWLCLPHFDSPAVFCRLLDADKGGYFRISPAEACEARMQYLPGTNILETFFETDHGRVRLVDAVPVRRRQTPPHVFAHLTSLLPHAPHGIRAGLEREVGNDVAAAHRINRILTCMNGEATLDLTLKPTFDYARKSAAISAQPFGNGALGAVISSDDRYLALALRYLPSQVAGEQQEPLAIDVRDGVLHATIPLQSGQRVAAALNYARSEDEARRILGFLIRHDLDADIDETMNFWRTWSSQCQYDGPYQEAIIRSALTLKLCTFEPTGAIVAAPTSSLPEDIGGVRNWDYRYTWLRDSAFTLGALGELGYYNEARDYFHFLHDLQIRNAQDLRIMYSIRGETDGALEEHDLTHLEGYKGSRPVRIGNGAANQRQMDVYGELADAAFSYVRMSGYRHPHRLSEPMRDLSHLTELLANYVADHWQDVDRGIWEVRGKPRAFVYSRAMCWVALDRACRLADHHGHQKWHEHWSQVRELIRNDIATHGYSEQLQSFTQSYGDETLDAANLRMSLTRYLDANNPRMSSTINVTDRLLSGDHGLLYRYRPSGAGGNDGKGQSSGAGSSDDGLPGSEGAFLACTYWYISNLCLQGRLGEARERFEQLLGYANPLGLFSEEIDPQSGALLGNYPQAFTHIGLINSAVLLQRAQEGRMEPITGGDMRHENATSHGRQ